MDAIECTPLEFVSAAIPYIYIGDSHALISTLVFNDPSAKTQIATPTYTAWGFAAHDVFDDGKVGTVLIEILRRCSALHSSERFQPTPGLGQVRTRHGEVWHQENLAVTSHSVDRPHVICVGDLNIRNVLHRVADDEVDFALPFPTDGLERLPETPIRAEMEFGQMVNVLLHHLGPIFQGLGVLRAGGLETLYLHGLPPPSLDRDAVSRAFGFRVPTRAHYKLTMLANYLYERACREIGIGFINIWNAVTDRNLRNVEYELDPVHLNRAGTILSVQEVHRQFTAYTLKRKRRETQS